MSDNFTKGIVVDTAYTASEMLVEVVRKFGGARCPQCKKFTGDWLSLSRYSDNVGSFSTYINFHCIPCDLDFPAPGTRATLVLAPNNFNITHGDIFTWGSGFAWWFPAGSGSHRAQIVKRGFILEKSKA